MNFKAREEGYVGDSGGGKGKGCNYIIVLKNKKNIKKISKFENK